MVGIYKCQAHILFTTTRKTLRRLGEDDNVQYERATHSDYSMDTSDSPKGTIPVAWVSHPVDPATVYGADIHHQFGRVRELLLAADQTHIALILQLWSIAEENASSRRFYDTR
jgi:hypothetical protein